MRKRALIILVSLFMLFQTPSVFAYSQDLYEKFYYTGNWWGSYFFKSPFRDASNNQLYPSVTSKYNNPRNMSSSPHGGVDFSAASGTNIYSIGLGKVVSVNSSTIDSSFGYYVVVQMDTNIDGNYDYEFVRYAHLQSCSVSVGQTVSSNTLIGKSGSTGTTAAHLHSDMRNNNNTPNGVYRHIPWQKYYSNTSNWNYGRELDWASDHGGSGRTVTIYCYGKTDVYPTTYAPDVIYLYVRRSATSETWKMYPMSSLGNYQYSYTIPSTDFPNGTTVDWFIGARRSGISSSYCDWGLYRAKFKAPQMEDTYGNSTIPSSSLAFATYVRNL